MAKNYSTNNSIQLIHSGTDFFDTVCRMIDSAKKSVHLHTYIFSNDETGTRVAACLAAAAKRKVDVFLLIDGYASQDLPDEFIHRLEEAGVQFRFFEPLFQSKHLYFGRRLHHKVVVIDGACSMVGGMNIADRYNAVGGQPAWFDLALYVEGPASAELLEICQQLWSKKRRLKRSQKKTQGAAREQQEHAGIRIRRNDWVKRKQEISSTYMELFRTAEDSITIMCSYFLPGGVFRKQLKRAVARGVKVKVILASMSDVPVSLSLIHI